MIKLIDRSQNNDSPVENLNPGGRKIVRPIGLQNALKNEAIRFNASSLFNCGFVFELIQKLPSPAHPISTAAPAA
jgi:hypothetical protein